jgi:hypothetical protein
VEVLVIDHAERPSGKNYRHVGGRLVEALMISAIRNARVIAAQAEG